MVAIINGKIETIWDVTDHTLEYPYDLVAAQLAFLVRRMEITGLFRSSERSYGAAETKQLLAGGTVKKWNHFYGTVAARHFTQTPDKARGDFNTSLGVFKRGLEELSADAFTVVTDLIEAKQLYRGEEHAAALTGFLRLKQAYDAPS